MSLPLMEPLSTALLLTALAGLLILSGLASRLSQHLGVPALLIFLLLGIAAGSEGIGGIPFADYALAFRLGTIALVLILFDGGLNTSADVFRRAAAPAGVLATVTVVLTALFVAGAGVLLGLSPPIAILVGAVVSSTDAAAVFAMLRGSGIQLKEKTGAVLEVESGLNDPMAVFLTFVATEVILGAQTFGLHTLWLLLLQGAVGLLGGVGCGFGGRVLLRAVHLPAAGLYVVLTVAIAFAAFGITTLLNGSGFLAVYLAAMTLAAKPLPYRAGIRRVHDGLAWLSQVLMFLLLGLLVFPSRLWPLAPEGVILAAALAGVARPLAVLLTLLPFPFSWRERGFLAWVGLRGAVPIILATYPLLRGVPAGEQIFHLVFFIVLINSVVPGATVAWAARRYHFAEPMMTVPPASVELVSLRDYPGDFVWYFVTRALAVCDALIRELPLPEGCVVILIVRGDTVVAARGATRLRDGDHVCVFVLPEHRPLVDLLFGRGSTEPE
ncbi:MAG: potassium/proton antiporter [Thermodesulfobacteriota bacterium]